MPEAVTQRMLIRVPGLPKAQPRVKAFRRGKFVRMYTPTTADEWKDSINNAVLRAAKLAVWQMLPLKTPLVVEIDYHLPRAGGFRKAAKWGSTKPDIDNLNKAVFDCLVWCGVMADDSQIVDIRARKLINNHWQGAIITVASGDFLIDQEGRSEVDRRAKATPE